MMALMLVAIAAPTVMAATYPSPPQNVIATTVNAQTLRICYDPPASDGGAAITNYRIYRMPGWNGNPYSTTDAGTFTGCIHDSINLQPYTNHCYQVTAWNFVGESNFSPSSCALVWGVPYAPTLNTPARGDGSMSLSWNAGYNGGQPITSYRLFRGTEPSFMPLITSGGCANLAQWANSCTDSGLTNGQAYYYAVTAINSVGESVASSTKSGTPAGAPLAPSLQAATPGHQLVSLSWTAAAPNGGAVTNYRIYRGTSSGATALLTTGGCGGLGNVLACTDAGLTNGQAYYYQVAGVNFVGTGTRSTELSATPRTVPGAPQNLLAAPGPGPHEINLNWQPPASNGGAAVFDYKVYRAASSGGPYELVITLNAAATSYQNNQIGLGNGVQWFYRVTAVNVAGEGAQSTTASATTFALPSVPQGFAVSAGPGAGEIDLAWQAPSSNGGMAVTAYRVYRADQAAGPFMLLAHLGNVATYRDTGLGNGVTRWYQVSAITDVGEGPRSPVGNARTFITPDSPPNLGGANGPGRGQVTPMWTSDLWSGGAFTTHYRLYQGPPGQPKSFLVQLPSTQTSFVHAGLADNETRCYQVTAVNIVGEGVASAERCLRAPNRPTEPRSVTATTGPTDGGSVLISWTPPADDGGLPLTDYFVFRSTASGGHELRNRVAPTATSFLDTELLPGVRYYYRVTTANAIFESARSSEASARASYVQTSMDPDGDGVPSLVEQRICGTGLLNGLVNNAASQGLLGACPDGSTTDYEPLTGVDGDDDHVPKVLEPALCGIEDQNSPVDGFCLGSNYHLPPYDATEYRTALLDYMV